RILEVKGKDLTDSLYRGVKKLTSLVSVTVDAQTNIVSLSVDAHYPALAAAVANTFVANLNAFNAQYRQSQAREQRKFVEQRLTDGEQALRAAEEGLRTFYERNRSWQQSPQLTFEEGRLRRQVEVRQELYLTLQREYEAARMQEVNGRSLAASALWSLAAQAIRAVVGVIAIPFIVRGLGVERFGVLTLAWMVIGYFSLFDLGLGRAVTKFAAELLGAHDRSSMNR